MLTDITLRDIIKDKELIIEAQGEKVSYTMEQNIRIKFIENLEIREYFYNLR